ncbi:Gfo/Idh/MocA family protein [Vagococcus xieshaowenii]|uniref:Gfo/Idh/MocA family oxidoreductase n=1 Tax=Vagococcus xieshaowenii TaxID=2562451 RepID=A0AAJ5EF23_9ENTE|nr:Gfo/Idh/MocA family oxidoreductase [Vagococcus xieshaowenii]QCA29297.1 Gfo/Idh/MocA family oxidoreductase [Vagococcus xieshaowenii]TFZ42008.1 Gfo/Idh/MocA family oxidoreductase [Vagococcus xieshaowenii]
MLKLGIIGTNWITHQFVDAAITTKEFELHSIYSRSIDSGVTFGEPFEQTNVYTNLGEFFNDSELEVVYIASPNSLHYEQAKQAILAGKHVITEKPAVSRLSELEELHQLADTQGVFYFEAARNIHEANFKQVAEMIPALEPIVAANFSFMKYSSRYDQVVAGEEPNIFSPKFSGGALMDLGVYLVYSAVAWFGKPREVHYFARKLPTGVDGVGHMIFRYEDFDVNMMTGKASTSFLPSEIIGHTQTISMNATNSIEKVSLYDHTTGETTAIPISKEENPMVEEAKAFATYIKKNDLQDAQYRQLLSIMHTVHDVMEQLRMQEGITFAADIKQ